jgi:hypothetical protein
VSSPETSNIFVICKKIIFMDTKTVFTGEKELRVSLMLPLERKEHHQEARPVVVYLPSPGLHKAQRSRDPRSTSPSPPVLNQIWNYHQFEKGKIKRHMI